MTERDQRDYDDAQKYFEGLFRDTLDVVHTSNESLKDEKEESVLPFEIARVLGPDERSALTRELSAYVNGALTTAAQLGQRQGGLHIQQMLKLLTPQMLLSFLAGYRHAIQEVELPELDLTIDDDKPESLP
jgi:hypothetical protein